MPTYLPTLVILSAAVLAILIILYRIYDSRVEQPKKLEDELKEGLGGYKADVTILEPVRKLAAASSFAGDRIVIVENFGKVPHKLYKMSDLMGMEVIVDNIVVGRVMRSGPHIMLDNISPTVHRVTMRLMFDDPSFPSFEPVIWAPDDGLTARAEGPRKALENVRHWFYHVEAVMRRSISAPRPIVGAPPSAAPVPYAAAASNPQAPSPQTPAPEPARSANPAFTPVQPFSPPESPPAQPAPAKPEGDVLNAPLIPYI